MRLFLCFLFFLPVVIFAQTLAGQWTFDNPSNLLHATVGNDLSLSGSHTITSGPTPTDGAINIGVGSYYKMNHGIPANGGGSMVNEFSLVFDFKVSSLSQWHCFMQTYYPNSILNDGDAFINTTGQIGVGATGYSTHSVFPNEWYRLVIAIDLGSTYKYYLDGHLIKDGGVQTLDGRFSLYPSDPAKPLLLFADNDGDDGPIDIAYAAMYNGCLNDTQVLALGGYGHSVTPSTAEMLPYLQTPSPTSMIVCWHGNSSTESRVEYGITQALGSSASGTVYDFGSSTKWHSVKLSNLLPNQEYFYKCYTGTQVSGVFSFHTAPAIGSRTGHFRFLIMGDSQSNPGTASAVVNRAVQQLTNLYGADWYNDVHLICHVGDTVFNGISLSAFTSEHFLPFGPLSSYIPTMVSIGNHELEGTYFYNYRKVEDIGGPEGEKYFYFDLGSMRFIFLNTNISTGTETGWFQTVVSGAQASSDCDFIFTFGHHPPYSEIWPDGNSTWMQNTVLPTLSANDKCVILANGHTHSYERGVSPDGNVATLICGGAGGTLDRWGEYSNQTDYNNTINALDENHYLLKDVNLENRSYHATLYGLGNPDLPRCNEIMDEWDYSRLTPVETAPYTDAQSAATGSQMILTASPNNHLYTQMSTRFQISSSIAFSSTLTDVTIQDMDIHGDTGSPLWQPTDLHANLDIWRYAVQTGLLTNGNTYYWRVKSRDSSLKWTDWSSGKQFIMQTQAPAADFVIHNPTVDVSETVYFVESSIGNATSYEWDFNNDGVTDSQLRYPNWTYSQPGIYNVTLRVIISTQLYTITKQVTVNGGSLNTPENVQIHRVNDEMHITWKPVPGATSYHVLYFTDPLSGIPITTRVTSATEIVYYDFASPYRGFFQVIAVQ